VDIRSENELLEPTGTVIMRKNDQINAPRQQFGFPDTVKNAFGFIAAEGFAVIAAEPTIVKFDKGSLVAVVYHGRQSYEVGFEIGSEAEQFSLADLIRSEVPAKASEYRNPVATTRSAVLAAVQRVADLVRRYGQPALKGDAEFFAELRSQCQRQSEAYALDVLASQLRSKAGAAFREGNYRAATSLYQRMSERLTPSEKGKLAVARRKSNSDAQQASNKSGANKRANKGDSNKGDGGN
jgi:hypothetical protein